jgi:hypothetical protein
MVGTTETAPDIGSVAGAAPELTALMLSKAEFVFGVRFRFCASTLAIRNKKNPPNHAVDFCFN